MNKAIVRKRQQYINNNTIESQRNIGGGGIVQHISDNAKGMVSDAWSQLLGPLAGEKGTGEKTAGDLTEGQVLILSNINTKVKSEEHVRALDIEPGIDYRREILYGYRKIAKENTQEISKKIQEIIVELKRLTASSNELQVEFKEVVIEQRVVNPGKYHASFFEWVLSAIRLARMKVEDSAAWLSVSKSKKAKREYWAMFKKHGTTFGLSNERVVATQTG
jgi:hypothetical protein